MLQRISTGLALCLLIAFGFQNTFANDIGPPDDVTVAQADIFAETQPNDADLTVGTMVPGFEVTPVLIVVSTPLENTAHFVAAITLDQPTLYALTLAVELNTAYTGEILDYLMNTGATISLNSAVPATGSEVTPVLIAIENAISHVSISAMTAITENPLSYAYLNTTNGQLRAPPAGTMMNAAPDASATQYRSTFGHRLSLKRHYAVTDETDFVLLMAATNDATIRYMRI